jgi:xylulokinase
VRALIVKVMVMTTWLAFDIGTTGTKAALLDDSLHVLSSAYAGYATHSAAGGVMEQNSDDWLTAAIDAARGLDAQSADAIVITGQMQDVILIDKDDKPTHPVILYSDTRAHAEAEAINVRLGADHLTALTGNEQGTGGLLAKLRWLYQHQPHVLTKAYRLFVGAGPFLSYRLTRIPVLDTTTASTTGLMQLDSRAWLHDDILTPAIGDELLRLRRGVMVDGGARVGVVSGGAAVRFGTRAGIPVHLAPGDAGAATLGAGAGESGQTYAYVGTSGWVAYTSDQRGDPSQGVFTLAHPHPERFICVAPLLTAGGNFDFAKSLFGAESHADLFDAALAQPPTPLIYLPYLNGERSPFSDPFARGAFIGLQPAHTAHDLTRAVLEGVAFAYKHALDALIRTPITRLMVTGGGAQSMSWCQLLADVTGVEVAIADDAEHVGLRGAVLSAQVASGERSSYALQQIPTTLLMPQDDSATRAHYEKQYGHYRAAYPALKGLFAAMR